MTARHVSLAFAALLAASSPRLAAADQEGTRSRDRGIFYAALAATGAGLTTWLVAGTRVQAAESDLEELGPELAAEQEYGDGYYTDMCDAADPSTGPVADEVQATCRRGDRWVTVARVGQVVTFGSAVVAAVFAYRAFRSPACDQKPVPPPRSAWRAQPIATPTAVGLGLDVEF